MAYDEGLSEEIRGNLDHLKLHSGEALAEQKMFGGLVWLLNGKIAFGVTASEFLVRLEPEEMEKALARNVARPMQSGKRPMKGFAFLQADEPVLEWMETSVRYVRKHMLSD